eukprot:scaffold18618_cov65-Isochrysis_galbana.AAC.1
MCVGSGDGGNGVSSAAHRDAVHTRLPRLPHTGGHFPVNDLTEQDGASAGASSHLGSGRRRGGAGEGVE